MANHQIEDICNFLKLSDFLATGGQPTESQFPLIKAAGYQVIINLALPDSPNALADEQAIVESLEMKYIHIPVIWEQPTQTNISHFFDVMTENANNSIFVHCAANKIVSVFIYLYRLYQGVGEKEAKQDLQRIWIPNHIWHNFIEQTINSFCL